MKLSTLLVVLFVLILGSYLSYLVTFRLFDSDSDGTLTQDEINVGIHKLVSPERNYNNAHERLLDDLHEYRTKIKLLEEELLRYKGSKIIEDFKTSRGVVGRSHRSGVISPEQEKSVKNTSFSTTYDVETGSTSINSSEPKSSTPSDVAYAKSSSLISRIPSSISNFSTEIKLELPPPRPASYDKLYYIYPLGEEFWWRWPKKDSGCDTNDNGYIGYEHSESSGLGRLLNADDGLFLTWHFSLFSSLYNRLIRSSRRTLDPSKASLFIIPYDLALDGYVNPSRCSVRRSCTKGLAKAVEENVTSSSYWQKYKGADHVLLWSLGQYHPWPHERCDVLMREICERCTITSYWMDATKQNNRFVSVPFPSAYHYHDDIKNLPWSTSKSMNRNQTAVYLGGIQTLNPTHTKIRRAMTEQCKANFLDCHWYQISHTSVDNQIADYLGHYKKSVYCLCPPGDDPARKAVFDSILSGCIPVIFELNTLYNQYPYNLGEQNARDISVYIPGGALRSGAVKFMDVLRDIKPEVVKKKQALIAKLAPIMQYSAPPLKVLENRNDQATWDPPFEDGVDAILNGIFIRSSRIIANESNHNFHRYMPGKAWGKEYNKVLVQEPK